MFRNQDGVYGSFYDSPDEEDDENEEESQNSAIDGPSAKKRRNIIPMDSLRFICCCSLLCFSLLTLDDINKCREVFNGMSRRERNQWVLDYLATHNRETEKGLEFLYIIGIQSVCFEAWRLVIGVSRATYYRLREKFLNGQIVISEEGFNRKGTRGGSTMQCITWISEYAATYGDKLPDSCSIHLPPCTTKSGLYQIYKEEMVFHNLDFVSESQNHSMWKMKIHVTGVIVHGIGTYGFFDEFQYAHDSNMTISCLVKVLRMMSALPEVLYLQCDNCFRENKNRYVFAFATYLVKLGIFKKVKVSYLMVGHTHEDVDQLFSRFSKWLNMNTAVTLDDLMKGFEACYTPHPTAILVNSVFNASEWLFEKLEKIQQHSRPHVFRFKKNSITGQVEMSYKKWSTDTVWTYPKGTSDTLLKEIPDHSPSLVVPRCRLDMHRIEADITTVAFPSMTKEQQIWWRNHFEYIQGDEYDENDEWPVSDFVKITDETRHGICSAVLNDIDEISDEDEPIRPIVLGKASTNIHMEFGDFLLTDMLKYADAWPQVGKCVGLEDNSVTVEWYIGSVSSHWKVHKIRQGRQCVVWRETIQKAVIIHSGFQLTKTNNLPKSVKDFLRDYDHNM